MQTRQFPHKTLAGTLKWLLPLAVILVLAVATAACGGDEEEAAPPATEAAPAETEPAPAEAEAAPAETEAAAPAECPFEGGVIRTFQTQDVAGVAGDLGPGQVRSVEIWTDILNQEGGILGCQLVVDAVDEPFPDVDQCLRNWRDAISQGDKYPFYLGAFNSACMAAVPDLTNAAGKAIIANNAADHQPFFDPKFQKYNIHAAVSTFLEGRASAKFAAAKGWKKIAILTPNYAYGQDVAKAFKEYFLQIVPDGEIVEEQFPEFDEKNFTPFVNAMVAKKPDAVFSGFFGPFVIPFWKQWKAGGHDDIPTISGLIDMPGWELVKSADEIPKNTYAYDRGSWQLVSQTPTGKKFFDAYVAKYGSSDHPLPLAWGFAAVSGIQMTKALIEKTQSLDPDDWIAAIEAGDFTYESVYHAGLTPVDPVNHMADTCSQVGLVTFDESLPVGASYDLNDFQNICMHDILTSEESKQLTTNPGVSDDAIAAYGGAVEELKAADAAIPGLVSG